MFSPIIYGIFFLFASCLFVACSQPLNKASGVVLAPVLIPVVEDNAIPPESETVIKNKAIENKAIKNRVIKNHHIYWLKESEVSVDDKKTLDNKGFSENKGLRKSAQAVDASFSRPAEVSRLNAPFIDLDSPVSIEPPHFVGIPSAGNVDDNHFFYDGLESEAYTGITNINVNRYLSFDDREDEYTNVNYYILDDSYKGDQEYYGELISNTLPSSFDSGYIDKLINIRGGFHYDYHANYEHESAYFNLALPSHELPPSPLAIVQRSHGIEKHHERLGSIKVYDGITDVDNQVFLNESYEFKEAVGGDHYTFFKLEFLSVEADFDQDYWFLPSSFDKAMRFDFSPNKQVETVRDSIEQTVLIEAGGNNFYKEELLQFLGLDWLGVVPTLTQADDPQYHYCKSIYHDMRAGEFDVVAPHRIDTEIYELWRQKLVDASLVQSSNKPLNFFILEKNNKIFYAFSSVFELDSQLSTIVSEEINPKYYFYGSLTFNENDKKKIGSVGRFYNEKRIRDMRTYLVYWGDTYYHLRIAYNRSFPSEMEVTPLFFADQVLKRNCRWKM